MLLGLRLADDNCLLNMAMNEFMKAAIRAKPMPIDVFLLNCIVKSFCLPKRRCRFFFRQIFRRHGCAAWHDPDRSSSGTVRLERMMPQFRASRAGARGLGAQNDSHSSSSESCLAMAGFLPPPALPGRAGAPAGAGAAPAPRRGGALVRAPGAGLAGRAEAAGMAAPALVRAVVIAAFALAGLCGARVGGAVGLPLE